jgi:hypothetical protein
MLRDNLVGLIEPMLSSAGAYTLALGTARKQSSDDRPPCLENPRPEGAESSLTDNVTSPFPAEPRQCRSLALRTAPADPVVRCHGDLDGERPIFVTLHAHLLVNEPYEMLHLIQDGLNLELNG